ncbi:MAG: DUF3341 domain-containing protein [Thermoanaerobaculales bacterium]|jgi:hypothetical protein|nr:DUF3341 domain-containing protein [Thermoanaerobaculales bacterium]
MSTETTTLTDSPAESALFGLVADFDKIDEFLDAVRKVREAGFTEWDTHTPFVIHGLDAAMGIKPTKLPFLVFGAGLTGCAAGIGLQWFTNAFDYPFLISGKPLFSLPANIPVAFEMTILFSAIAALVGMLAFNGLPRLSHPLHGSRLMKRATDDRFLISIEASDPNFDHIETRELLQSLGPLNVEAVEA